MKEFLKREAGQDLAEMQEKIIYIGDAANDESAFREIRHSVGVAKLDGLASPPRYTSVRTNAEGFSETAARILGARGQV